jgi:hypothetical protein
MRDNDRATNGATLTHTGGDAVGRPSHIVAPIGDTYGVLPDATVPDDVQ